MESNSGISIKDAQYAICKGTYGGRQWSATERQAACHRYEQITGVKVESSDGHADLLIVVAIVVLILTVILVALRSTLHRRKKFGKKYNLVNKSQSRR